MSTFLRVIVGLLLVVATGCASPRVPACHTVTQPTAARAYSQTDAAPAPLRACPASQEGLRAALLPLRDARCVSTEHLAEGTRLRYVDAGPDNCGEATAELLVWNCTSESLTVRTVRTKDAAYELADSAVAPAYGMWRTQIEVGMDAGPVWAAVSLESQAGERREVVAKGRVRKVLTRTIE